jgi:hypothetical protein
MTNHASRSKVRGTISMATALPFDRRLLGKWQSDRLRTFRHYKPQRTVSEQQQRRFKSLFGKMVIRWGRRRVST